MARGGILGLPGGVTTCADASIIEGPTRRGAFNVKGSIGSGEEGTLAHQSPHPHLLEVPNLNPISPIYHPIFFTLSYGGTSHYSDRCIATF